MRSILYSSLFLLIGLLASASLRAQDACAFEPSAKQIEKLTREREAIQAFNLREKSVSDPTWFPVQWHVVEETLGGPNGFFRRDYVDAQMAELNRQFRPAGIQFYECGPEQYIYDTNLHNLYIGRDSILTNNYDIAGVINLYYVNQIYFSLPNGQYCGYAYFPGDPDHIVLAKGCLTSLDPTLLTHEMGHFFTLYHTHGKTNASPTDELVDGSNCATAGDDVCDTPADPNLLNGGVINCEYVGGQIDIQLDTFMPLVDNIMSYAPAYCTDALTEGQLSRMAYAAAHSRAYLTCTTSAPCASPVTNYPYGVDFENGFGDWTTSIMDWMNSLVQVGSGPTPTAGTGPTAAQQGNNYAYVEASNGYALAALTSPCLDLRGLRQPTLTYWVHQYGPNAVAHAVQADSTGGNTWGDQPVIVFAYLDQDNTQDQWRQVTVDLSSYRDLPYLQLRIVLGGGNGGELGDIAIDDLQIFDAAPPCTLETLWVMTPESCPGQADGSVEIQVFGGVPPYSYAWSSGATTATATGLAAGTYEVTVTDAELCERITLTGVAAGTAPSITLRSTDASGSNALNGTIVATETGTDGPYGYQWSTGATAPNLSGLDVGGYTVTVTNSTGCSSVFSAYIGEASPCTGYDRNFPYSYDMETGLGRFRQNSDDDKNWKRRDSSTPTNNTGPAQPYQGQYYRYLESSNSRNQGKTSILTTRRCQDMTGVTAPVFEFFYNLNGSTMGTLEVQLSEDGGLTWTESVWSETGDQSDVWQRSVIHLDAYQVSDLRIRILGTTGNGNFSDMAIDGYYLGPVTGNPPGPAAQPTELPAAAPTSAGTVAPVAVANEPLDLFPNPNNGQFTLTWTQVIDETLDVDIFDAAGRLLHQSRYAARAGGEQLLLRRALRPGVYTLLLRGRERVLRRRFVVK